MSDKETEFSEKALHNEADVEYAEKQQFNLKRMHSKDLKTMRREVADWLTGVTGKSVSPAKVLQELKTGETLLHCAKSLVILKTQDEDPTKELDQHELEQLIPDVVDTSDEGVPNDPQTLARCRTNIAKFLTWCRKIGVDRILLFESEDLVIERNERQVLNCILKITELFSKHGIEPPESVKKEMEHKATKKRKEVSKSTGSTRTIYPKNKTTRNTTQTIVETTHSSIEVNPNPDQDSQSNRFSNLDTDQNSSSAINVEVEKVSTEQQSLFSEQISSEFPTAVYEMETTVLTTNETTQNSNEINPALDEDILLTTNKSVTNGDVDQSVGSTKYVLSETEVQDLIKQTEKDAQSSANIAQNSQIDNTQKLDGIENKSYTEDAIDRLDKDTIKQEIIYNSQVDDKQELDGIENKSFTEDSTNPLDEYKLETKVTFKSQVEDMQEFDGMENKSFTEDAIDRLDKDTIKQEIIYNSQVDDKQELDGIENKSFTEDSTNPLDEYKLETKVTFKSQVEDMQEFDGMENKSFTEDSTDGLEKDITETEHKVLHHSQIDDSHRPNKIANEDFAEESTARLEDDTGTGRNVFKDDLNAQESIERATNQGSVDESFNEPAKEFEEHSMKAERISTDSGDLYTLLSHSFKTEKHDIDLDDSSATSENADTYKVELDSETPRLEIEKPLKTETNDVSEVEEMKNNDFDDHTTVRKSENLESGKAESGDSNVVELARQKPEYSTDQPTSQYLCCNRFKPVLVVSAIAAVIILAAVIVIAVVFSRQNA